jgi:hypothetical protein
VAHKTIRCSCLTLVSIKHKCESIAELLLKAIGLSEAGKKEHFSLL